MSTKKKHGVTYEYGAFFKYQELFKSLLDLMIILPSERIGDKGEYFQNSKISNISNQSVILELRNEKTKIMKNIKFLFESLSNYHSSITENNNNKLNNNSFSPNKFCRHKNMNQNNLKKLSSYMPIASIKNQKNFENNSIFNSINKIKKKNNLKINELKKPINIIF